jgi:signal peptide peptidase SppA
MTRAADLVSSLPLPPALKERLPSPKPVVAVVKLQGVITATPPPPPRGGNRLATVEDAHKRAFAEDRLQAVALVINSPGGSPTQSALVGDRIRQLAAEKDVPVIAFCEDVAASGGYWLACAADEIVVHDTSIVGAIGVVTQGFGLDGLNERHGVERRLYTAGESKARQDPFLPEKPDDVVWLRGLQGELHELFVAWVRERRGPRLAADADLFTGEVWTGAKAVENGLADRLGTLHGVLEERYPDAQITPVDARKPLLARLGVGGSAASLRGGDGVRALLEAVEERAAWSRFGL